MKRVGFYPGCTFRSTAKEYDMSLLPVLERLGIEVVELPDWSCCGATSAHVTQELLSVALPARNLAIAEAQGFDTILAPCAACFSRLAVAQRKMAERPALAQRVQEILDRPFGNSVKVINITDFLISHLTEIGASVTTPLQGMKLACYYGCLLVRPHGVAHSDDPEVPTSMERIVAATKATPVKWNMALECCGGGMSFARTGSVIRLGRAIVDDARAAGAQALVVGCPMCHNNLDLRQKAMEKGRETKPPIPILFISQVVGLAMGMAPKSLGANLHFVSTRDFMETLARLDRALPETATHKATNKEVG